MAEMTQRVSYGWYFVAFIDLLGQQEGLMKLTQLSPLHENRDKIHDGVLATASRVKSIRETFSHTFNDIPRLVLEKADTVSPEERARYVEFHGGLRFHHAGFSDAFMLGFPLNTDETFGFARDALAVLGALHTIASLTLKAMGDWGIPLRGGIDIGYGLDLYPNEVYGPVTVSAYKLESKVAEYPRIAIGEGLLGYLSFLERQPRSDWNGATAVRHSLTCKRIITVGPDDGRPMLHLVSTEVLASGENAELALKALQWARTEHERHRQSANEKLEQRYRRLLRYFELEMPAFSRS